MTKVMRQRSRVVAIIRQLVAGAIPQHVRMNWEWLLGASTGSLNHPQEPRCGHWRPGLGDEHVQARPLQWPQRSKAQDRLADGRSQRPLRSIDVQSPMPEIDLRPTKLTKLPSLGTHAGTRSGSPQ